ncbi:MAG: hypothetical protein AAF485_10550 [Chloroflexota bacterium]
MKRNTSVPLYILIYTIFITLFTALMVGFSIFSPENFFQAYGVVGDTAFQYSWSFRYMVILIIMGLGLIRRTPEAIFMTILSRFLVDLFDVVGIFIYNTPPFSVGSMAFQVIALLGPQLFCLTKLYPLLQNK